MIAILFSLETVKAATTQKLQNECLFGKITSDVLALVATGGGGIFFSHDAPPLLTGRSVNAL
ncbi:hypothetical protein N879_13455 [Alcaligenes sp. EGD-AK7]|nr:hypothetical protein N879_13455 [Alcaligenes sp. EGD-AK7]